MPRLTRSFRSRRLGEHSTSLRVGYGVFFTATRVKMRNLVSVKVKKEKAAEVKSTAH